MEKGQGRICCVCLWRRRFLLIGFFEKKISLWKCSHNFLNIQNHAQSSNPFLYVHLSLPVSCSFYTHWICYFWWLIYWVMFKYIFVTKVNLELMIPWASFLFMLINPPLWIFIRWVFFWLILKASLSHTVLYFFSLFSNIDLCCQFQKVNVANLCGLEFTDY